MKFFIDSADIEEIRDGVRMGLVDGVTTNPTLVAKSGRDYESVVKDIAQIVEGPISVECVAPTADEILPEGRRYAEWAPNVVIKVPCTPQGLAACKAFAEEEIDCNVTLVFSPVQSLLVARAGARFVSPFVGRLDDVGEIGMNMVKDICQIYDNYGFETEVLVASCRNPTHVLEAALVGADVCTCPYALLKQLIKHPLTDAGIERFNADYARIPKGTGAPPARAPPQAPPPKEKRVSKA